MRLLDTITGVFVEKDPEKWEDNGRLVYAILSHTWDEAGEQTYGELRDIQRRYEAPKSRQPQNHPTVPEAPSNTAASMPLSPAASRHLTQFEVEALFRQFVETYNLPNGLNLQSLPSVPEGVASSGEQDFGGLSSGSPLSERPQSNCSSATTRLTPRSKLPKSCLTRGIARLKTWFRYSLPRKASHLPPDFPSSSAAIPLLPALGRPPSLNHNEGGPSHAAPPSQLPNSSESPSALTACPPTAIGRLTQSEVEALFRAFVETHELSGVAPAHIPSNTSLLSPDHQPSSSLPPSDTLSAAPCSPADLGRLTESEVNASRAFVQAYGLANLTPAPAPTGAPALDPQHKPPRQSIWDDPELSPKIRDACRVARENGYRYIWIDSCCIDKSSSSELSEAINSMYKWYSFAKVCYAYLADVPPGEAHDAEESAFRKSRWFRRGWTLQELIAPFSVEFLSQDWASIDSKHALVNLVEIVTQIDYRALLHLEPLDAFTVAQRLSWAAKRETTRVEDTAYSLLGIFGINMPTLYGEGNHAFQRLQEQIIQRTPDQSLFAWGDVYLSSKLTKIRNFADTSKGLRARVQQYDHDEERCHLLAMSPGRFQDCGRINTPRNNTAPFLSHLTRHEIKYTSTPYGVRTQFWMIHLTQDLHSLRIPLHNEDVQLEFPDLPESSEWYLAILKCEHQEQPGHLLGRVCYLSPSETNIQSMHAGYIWVTSPQGESLCTPPDLLPLSPETIERCRPQTELKTIYIPHPDRAPLSAFSTLRYVPYTAIKLLLLTETRDTLHSRGYSADLCDPDPDHPTTHCLTLFKDERTIAVEFQHTLEERGYEFTIKAAVKMSGSHVQLDSEQADRHTVSWSSDCLRGWETKLRHKRVILSAAGAQTVTVSLALDFVGYGYYILRIDDLNDAPPASSAVDGERDGRRTQEGSQCGAITTEDVGSGDLEETGGRETMPSAEAGDAATTSDNTEDGDGDGVST